MPYEIKQLQIEGRNVKYFDVGKGMPLIALHGWISGKEIYIPMIDFLKEHYRIIVPDLPGFGETDPLDPIHTLSAYNEFMEKFTEALNLKKYYMIGTSIGGTIIFLHAHKNPDKVLKLVLNAPFYNTPQFPKLTGYRLSAFIIRNIIRYTFVQKFYHFQAYLYQKFRKGKIFKENNEGEMWEKNKFLIKTFGEKLKITPSHVIAETMTEFMSTNIENIVKEIETETLIFWAKKDHIFNVRWAYRLNNLMPNARLHVFKKGSHYSITEKMDIISQEIKHFLPISV